MLVYKIDVLESLKEAGYSTHRLQKEKLIPASAIMKIHNGVMVGNITLDRICQLLDMQPGNIIKWIPDETEES